LPDSPTALNELMFQFLDFADQTEIPRRVRREMHIVFDELVSNIIRHGYDDGDSYDIVVDVQYDGDELVTQITDDARPFNLLELAAPEKDPSKRGIGGLGVFIVRELMDEVEYQREGDRNIVTMTRRITEFDREASQ
jgi:anti-sigma regulatory factor (Ser/Thr protein kinase)